MPFQSMVFKALVAALSVSTALAAAVPEKHSSKIVLLDFRREKYTGGKSFNGTAASGEKRDVIPVDLGRDQIMYLIQVNAGSEAETITVQLDTGSSNTWFPVVGATCPCQESARYDPDNSYTSEYLYGPLTLYYGIGQAQGSFYKDTVALTEQPQVSLSNLQFAGVTDTDLNYGILGIGFDNGEFTTEYPNFAQTLKDQGYVSKNAYSLYLNSADATQGSILFGGKDTAKYQGQLSTLPITHPYRLAVALNSFSIGSFSVNGNQTNSMFDSGTTYTWLVPGIFDPLAAHFGWTQPDPSNPSHIGPCQGDDVVFDFGYNTKITIPYNLMVLPYQGNQCYIKIFRTRGTEVLNTLGDNFLRSVYTVFDLDNRQLQVAPVVYTTASNIVPL
jgi:candidapepsin